MSKSYTHTRLTALFPGLPRWVGTRKSKPIWILLKQETVSGSGTEGKKLKVKFSHTRYRALGPELILVYRQSARR